MDTTENSDKLGQSVFDRTESDDKVALSIDDKTFLTLMDNAVRTKRTVGSLLCPSALREGGSQAIEFKP